jgi:hypothetical protein
MRYCAWISFFVLGWTNKVGWFEWVDENIEKRRPRDRE